MTDKPDGGVATQVRQGGRYLIDPETGEERRDDNASAAAPAPETPKRKVK